MNMDEIATYIREFVQSVRDWIVEHPNQRPHQEDFQQLTKERYDFFRASEFWTLDGYTDEEIAYFQLFNDRFMMEYKYFIQALSRLMGRTVIRYEVLYDEFYNELFKRIPPRTVQQVIADLHKHNPNLNESALIQGLHTDLEYCKNK